MEKINCPFCSRKAGFDPSTGEVTCQFCGVLEPPTYEPVKKPFATCLVLKPIPSFMGSGNKPWHAEYLEMHLMGIQRSMFRGDRFSNRYNAAVAIEHMYRGRGLVTCFSMN